MGHIGTTRSEQGTNLTYWTTAAQERHGPRAAYRLAVDLLVLGNPHPAQGRGHQHRPDPGGAVVGLDRDRPPVRQADGVAGLRAGLADRTGYGAEQRGLVPAGAGGVLGE